MSTLRATVDPTPGSTGPILENERVRVWETTLTPGQATPMQHHDLDFVTMFLSGGEIRTTTADGKSSVASRSYGDAVYGHAGAEQKEEVISKEPARIVVIELKNAPSPLYVNKDNYPPAMPRPGSKKVFENDRVICWNYTWVAGKPTPVHFHALDTVVIHRYEGAIHSTTLDGKVATTNSTFGTVRFNLGNRIHSEELASGQQSAMMVELK